MGDLVLHRDPKGLVIFANGSGSSRHSVRNKYVASVLRAHGLSTLLLVGGYDDGVIELNEQAYALLNCEKEMTLIPGATHLFEEAGTLEQVAELAAQWFVKQFPGK